MYETGRRSDQLTNVRGLIGPQRLFSAGSTYSPQVYAAVAGAIVPIPLWFWVRRKPGSTLRNLNLPVLINGPMGIPVINGVNYSSFLIVGFIFQFWVRRRHFAWWSKVCPVLCILPVVFASIRPHIH